MIIIYKISVTILANVYIDDVIGHQLVTDLTRSLSLSLTVNQFALKSERDPEKKYFHRKKRMVSMEMLLKGIISSFYVLLV